MRERKREIALGFLQSYSESFGVDRIIEDPIGILQKKMKLSKDSARFYLKELKIHGDIDNCWLRGVWEVVRLITINGNRPTHKLDARGRTIKAIWKFRELSSRHLGKHVIHRNFFNNIISEADIDSAFFRKIIPELEKKGLLTKIIRGEGRGSRTKYLLLSDNFSKILPV